MSLRDRWRLMRPENGRQYELFDCSVFLLILLFIGYVVTMPSPTQLEALEPLFDLLPQQVWGAAGSLAALYGIFASYFPRLVSSGYLVTLVASGAWTAVFLVGFANKVPLILSDEIGCLFFWAMLVLIVAIVTVLAAPRLARWVGTLLAVFAAFAILASAVGYSPSVTDEAVESLRMLINLTLYGWIARRLWREEDREYDAHGLVTDRDTYRN